MKQRLSKVEASQELGVSISTIDRMIRRGDLQIEREGTKSNDRVWVILEGEEAAEAGEEAAEAGDGASASASVPAAAGADDRDATELREQLKELQGQVKHLEELAAYRAELLKEGEFRFHALLQELSSSHRTSEALTRALPEPPQPAQEVPRKRWWWPFRRDAR